MSETHVLRLCKDPFLPWDGPFPYERIDAILRSVGHGGIGPASTVVEVLDADYDLLMLAEGMTEANRALYHQLSSPGYRLFLDFCHYQLRASLEESADAPLPVARASLLRLTDAVPALTSLEASHPQAKNPSPQPPPPNGEGEPEGLAPPLRFGEGAGGRGSSGEGILSPPVDIGLPILDPALFLEEP